ncbi:MAG: hypothetical protein AAF725_00625 [Acidobacteriota bacterium]
MIAPPSPLLPRPVTLVLAALVAIAWSFGVVADDRDLLRETSATPQVMVVVDTSGSMNWTPPCSEDEARSDIDPWDMQCTSVCPYDDPTCQQICPDFGCIDYAADQTASTPIEVIVDSSDSTGVTLTGPWGTSSSGGNNGSYHFLSAGTVGDAVYTATLPEAGEYQVYARWVRRRHRAENVETRVDHANGSNYLEIDQRDRRFDDTFVYLGAFEFAAGPTGAVEGVVTVTNRNADGGSTATDAVRFSRLPEPTGLAGMCNATGYRCQQPLCPQGDCYAPLGADDPTSKFFQARQAIDEVLSQVPDVNFGFASFQQDAAALRYKHYMYRYSDTSPAGVAQSEFNDFLSASEQIEFTWPIVGNTEVFGTGAPFSDGRSNDSGLFHCDTQDAGPGAPDDDVEVGCHPEVPADIEDIWEMDRISFLPKLGRTGQVEDETTIFIRDTNGTVYCIDYEYYGFNRSVSGSPSNYGDPQFRMQLDLHECLNDDCSSRDNLVSNMDVFLDYVSDFAYWQGATQRYPMAGGGFFNNQSGIRVDNTCGGLEPNEDFSTDIFQSYAYKNESRLDPRGDNDIDGTPLTDRVTFFDYGDFIPLDWDHQNTENVRRRLAPNAWQLSAASDPTSSIIDLESTGELPDFRSGVYFNDEYTDFGTYSGTNRRLRLRDESERPMLARGRTPLYRSLLGFKEWYAGPDGCNQATQTCGWRSYAEIFDLNFACRQRYVLMITDGDETCDGVQNACNIASTLFNSFQVRTFVVGYGLAEGSGDALTCIAENGGTGEPIYPQNRQDLVDRLLDVFEEVKAESRSFASASIPAVQSSASDKIYLSSFLPAPDLSIWPGRVDVFRQPLPLDDNNEPLVTLECTSDLQSGCHLYEVGEKLLSQAPDASTLDNTSLDPADRFGLKVGRDDSVTTDVDESAANVSFRRVLYSQENLSNERPGPLRLIWPPDKDATYSGAASDRFDLAQALVSEDDLSAYFTCTTGTCEDDLDVALQAAVRTLVEPRVTSLINSDGDEVPCLGDPDDSSNTPCRFVLGDIFHANPQVLSSPADFDFFRQDLCGAPPEDGQPNNCVPANNFGSAEEMRARGYREFVRRNVFRRRALITSTNDGQLHFFDAGKYVQIGDDEDDAVFTDGTGFEMFSYVPRLVLPIMREQVHGDQHIYSLDGSPRIADVFIDPVPNSTGNYEVNDREWRTVLISGLREAGSIFDSDDARVASFESGYYALDLTSPDAFRPAENEAGDVLPFAPWVPEEPGKFLPTCFDVDDESGRQTASTIAGCQTATGESTPFPLELWTFQDTVSIGGQNYFVDEDDNDQRDLGDTWSVPVVGQITLCREGGTRCAAGRPGDETDDDLETRWVAMFGGGLDPANINNPQRGDRFYIVDIETGQTLLSRQVDGAVPSDPAAIDIDNDGVIDRVYFGTTSGTMYKLQLTPESGTVPSIESMQLQPNQIIGWTPANPNDTVTVERVTSPLWEPFPIFTNPAPIFYPPTLFKIPTLEQYGLAFGNGYRENLWQTTGFQGAFFVFVDEDFVASDPSLPFDDTELVHFDWTSTDATDAAGVPIPGVEQDGNLLLPNSATSAFRPGWVLDFEEDFKTTNPAFAFGGILVFSVFDPTTVAFENAGDGSDDCDAVCARDGVTYSFVVSLQNASSFADLGNCGGRCEVIEEFTTAIHTDRSVSKNPPSGQDTGAGSLGDNSGTTVDEELANALREAILEQSPRSCQFNENYEIVVSALRSTTGLNVYAKIPMLVCPGDWRGP